MWNKIAVVVGVIWLNIEMTLVLAQGPAAGAAAAAAGMMAGSAGITDLMNPMGPGRPFVPGMTAGQVSDLMGGRPGPVPMDIAQEAAALRMAGWTPDQIADVLGDKLQARYGNPMLALAMNGGLPGGAGMPAGPPAMPVQPPMPVNPTPPPSGRRRAGVVSRGAAKSPPAKRPPKPSPSPAQQVSQADAALGVISRMPMNQPTPDAMGVISTGQGAAGVAGGAAPGAAMANMAGAMLNPMGPGRPFIPGMTPGQVSDLMGGRPGPVPMDIAQEAAALRMAGWTPDQIADVLGDKLQRRFSNPLGAAVEASFMNSLQGGATAGGAANPMMGAANPMMGAANPMMGSGNPMMDAMSAVSGGSGNPFMDMFSAGAGGAGMNPFMGSFDPFSGGAGMDPFMAAFAGSGAGSANALTSMPFMF